MKILLYLIICLGHIEILSADTNLKQHLNVKDSTSLKKILKKRYIRVLTTKNPYDYYVYQGEKKGIQYEMVKAFVAHLNKKYTKKKQLKIVFEMVPVDFDQLIPMLNKGLGDFIAVGLTKTAEREKHIDFTRAYQRVDDVIVTRKDLAQKKWEGQTFHIQDQSSYFYELKKHPNLVKIDSINANFHPDTLMEFISLKKFDYTLANSFWAQTLSKRFKNLMVIKDQRFRKDVPLSWGVPKGKQALLKEMNQFLPKVSKGSFLGNILNRTYFENLGRIKNAHFSLEKNQLSPYDELLKKYAQKYDFDWRLLAALCFQESKFNQNIINRWGAIGLFQVKQKTANEPYVNIRKIAGMDNLENNIHAGVKYLAWIKKRYFDGNKKMSEATRLRMAMASYNAGPARVQQAIRKTKKLGLDPHKWFRNVELGMLKMGYNEPVVYVSEINKHFVAYDQLGIKK
jgi:membrane-bound lytic murein transglycosylase MltF